MSGGSGVQRIQETFADYLTAFSEGNYQKVATMFSVPTVLCQSDTVTLVTSVEMVIELQRQLRASLPDDYATTRVVKDEVVMLDDGLGSLHGIYERKNVHGQVVSRGQGLYVMRRTGAVWKVCAITVMAHPIG